MDDTGNIQTAIELGSRLHPDSEIFKITLCKTYAELRDFDSALKLINELDIHDDKEIDLVYIECLCELNRSDEAINFIDELSEADSPYLEDAVVHAACVLNDIEEKLIFAYHFINNALISYPDNLSLKSELCFNLEQQGKIREALILCNELINEDPYSAETWYMYGRINSLSEHYEKAIDSFDFALSCIDDDEQLAFEISIMKAYCLYKNDNFESAVDVYLDLMQTGDESMILQIEPFLAECYLNIYEYEKAFEILKRLINKDDIEDQVSIYGNYIFCCIETERNKEAIEALMEALRRFPHSILEHLSTLNIIREQLSKAYTGREDPVSAESLAYNYLNNKIHIN
jgi:tetratricopeptide (TPR) repeat protein